MQRISSDSRLTRGGIVARSLIGTLLLAMGSIAPVPGIAAKSDADLLKELEGEAQKVGGASSGDASKGGGEAKSGAPAAGEGGAFPSGLTQEQFGKALKEAYSGTHAFYAKLAPNIQDEIYLDYKKGATIEQIRAKISERTLHR